MGPVANAASSEIEHKIFLIKNYFFPFFLLLAISFSPTHKSSGQDSGLSGCNFSRITKTITHETRGAANARAVAGCCQLAVGS